jgi:hypothetical protein
LVWTSEKNAIEPIAQIITRKRTRPSRVSVRARTNPAAIAAGSSAAHSHMPWPICEV